jgi:flagellar biosynthesis component FlhA
MINWVFIFIIGCVIGFVMEGMGFGIYTYQYWIMTVCGGMLAGIGSRLK